MDEFNDSPEKDIDFEVSNDGDSDLDFKNRYTMRRKFKKERKDAILSGVKPRQDRQEDKSISNHTQMLNEKIKGTPRLGRTLDPTYAPTDQTRMAMTPEALRKAELANAALFGPMKR